ncbi:hypothetical protein [Archaeoglobus sp.]
MKIESSINPQKNATVENRILLSPLDALTRDADTMSASVKSKIFSRYILARNICGGKP